MLSTLANNHFIFRLAYLADIIEQINKVNLKLQGRGRKSVDFIDTLSAFVEKFDNCERAAQTGHFVVFENLSTAAGDEVNADIASEVVQHLGGLREEFVLYFPEIINTNSDWVKNLFVVPVKNFADCMQDVLIHLRNDSGIKYFFETNTICYFGLKVTDSYPNVGEALIKLLLLPSSQQILYLSGFGFSIFLHVKTKYRNRLDFTLEQGFSNIWCYGAHEEIDHNLQSPTINFINAVIVSLGS